jgi:hypothetical protein
MASASRLIRTGRIIATNLCYYDSARTLSSNEMKAARSMPVMQVPDSPVFACQTPRIYSESGHWIWSTGVGVFAAVLWQKAQVAGLAGYFFRQFSW